MNTTISSDNNEQTQIQNNRIGTAGLVLVLMSFILFSFEGYIINSLNDKSLFFTLILPVLIGNLWLLGLIFSIIGLRINPKGRAIAGLIISLLPIILFFIYCNNSKPTNINTYPFWKRIKRTQNTGHRTHQGCPHRPTCVQSQISALCRKFRRIGEISLYKSNRIKMRHRATPLHSQFRQRVYHGNRIYQDIL